MEAILETFRPVVGYEGLYEVSDYGCVRSLNYNHTGKTRYLKNTKNRDGYECIDLYRDGKKKQFKVHRLVYEAFVEPIPDGYEIDHINTIRNDNRLSNLRVVTHKENSNNSITLVRLRESNQRKSKDPKWREANRKASKRRSQDPQWIEATREAGKRRSQNPEWVEATREANRNRCSKPILQLDKQTDEIIRKWDCARDAWRELGINHQSISACCNNNRTSAGGFKWKFAS